MRPPQTRIGEIALIELLSRLVIGYGAGADWPAIAVVAVVGAFVVYVGVALAATLTTRDAHRASFRRKVLRDLLNIIRPRRS